MRSVILPSTIDANKIEADFEDGVIEITLPKAKEARPKKVEVKAKKQVKAKTEAKVKE
jgi:HSP20 family protein